MLAESVIIKFLSCEQHLSVSCERRLSLACERRLFLACERRLQASRSRLVVVKGFLAIKGDPHPAQMDPRVPWNRGTSLIGNRTSPNPCRGPMPRVLVGS